MPRARSILISVPALWLASVACAKLVGITDTPVTRDDSSDAGVQAMAGSGGSPTDVTVAQGAAGMGGAGGSSSPAPSVAGSGGSAEPGPMAQLDGGVVPDAAPGPCTEATTRCGAAGREVCGSGVWQPEACPLNTPTCEGEGQCVVRGPTMINVGGAFFIDATEVTVDQYGLFLAAKGNDVSGQSAVCSWNQSYYEGPVAMDPGNYPMSSVDWCDAAAYCAWAGKHLCGHIGGGPIARADLFDENLSQWFVSCGGGGFHPNENSTCNSTSGALAAVASTATCEGFYPGLFDMVGNVAEWIDSCDGSTGAGDTCYLMGGGIFDPSQGFCDEVYDDVEEPYHRNSTAISFGFRCCAG